MVSDTDGGAAHPSGLIGPQYGEPKLPESAGGAIAEQLARIEQVIWSTPIAVDTEPWVTPRWVPVDRNRATGEANNEQHG
jgi:hypothetical protein